MISEAEENSSPEKQSASDADLCRRLSGDPRVCRTELFSDEELLSKLRTVGLDLSRSSVVELCDDDRSSNAIIDGLIERSIFKDNQADLRCDWILVCFDEVRRRWCPNKPVLWALHDKVQQGYRLLEGEHTAAACDVWLEAWSDVLAICDKKGWQSIAEFDAHCDDVAFLHNWIQDLEMELWNAGLDDPRFLTTRISVCEEAMRRFAPEHGYEWRAESWRRAIAEAYFGLGEIAKAEGLYREWLQDDPRWGWGWISWSDCHAHQRTQLRNLERAEELLLEGLSAAKVRDRESILDRLADIREEQGRNEEAKELRRQSEAEYGGPVPRPDKFKREWEQLRQQLSEPGLRDSMFPPGTRRVLPGVRGKEAPAQKRKISPNDYCPCGSNKKFKKCCGQKS